MKRYSVFSLLRSAYGKGSAFPCAWGADALKKAYDVVIIGGGGHGLATAFYLAAVHRIRNIAVIERGWIGGGNTGRNTTIVRANYAQPGNTEFYKFSLDLWENLSQTLNFNVMYSKRGVVNLFHSPAERESWLRRYNTLRLKNIDADILTAAALARLIPNLDMSPDKRYPILGAVIQRQAGTARHDAVAWGYARAAHDHGVDIIQGCEVTGIVVKAGKVAGLHTTQGAVAASTIGSCVAGNTSTVAGMVGIKVPVETHLLQAMVTEPIKPMINHVVSSSPHHVYISQTDKGEIVLGGRLDGYNSYSQRGSFSVVQEVLAGACELFPQIANLKLMRTWAGAVDMTMDGAPILSGTSVPGFYINGGWCYGGFKATPASGYCFAQLLASGAPPALIDKFGLDRFHTGRVVNERGMGPNPGDH